ncbi:MAG: AraC family transcriptional regulator [Planctomycetes bacterium]|nr:AraC family transcriptional regulator [Planctomycetota bacterium]
MASMPPGLLVPFPSGTPVFSGSHGHYRSYPGHLPVRLLHNDWDLLWVHGGRPTLEFKDGTVLSAAKDQFLVIPPFVSVLVGEQRAGTDFHYCHFHFRPPPVRIPKALHDDAHGPGARAILPLHFTRREAPGVLRAYAALVRVSNQAVEGRKKAPPWRMERAVCDLATALAQFALERTERRARRKLDAGGRLLAPAAPVDERIETIRRRIEANPARAWSVVELAASADLSTGHLSTLCQRVLGRSLKQFIVETRLQHALKLLKERPDGRVPSVLEVSEACGFSSQHFFSRQFKAYFRIGPLAYRNGATLE